MSRRRAGPAEPRLSLQRMRVQNGDGAGTIRGGKSVWRNKFVLLNIGKPPTFIPPTKHRQTPDFYSARTTNLTFSDPEARRVRGFPASPVRNPKEREVKEVPRLLSRVLGRGTPAIRKKATSLLELLGKQLQE